MFFIVSKILYFLIQPLNWIVGLLIWSIFTKSQKHKKRLVIWAVGLALFFSNHFIYNLVIRAWEPETVKMNELQEPYEIGILLGGYSNPFIVPNDDRHNFNSRGNRFFQTLELYKSGKIKKILLTGGSGNILYQEDKEANMMRKFLLKIGVPEADFIIEPESRNTRENALFTKEILDKNYPNANCLLITSAFHMRRSMGCFEQVGIDFQPFAVDYNSEIIKFEPSDFIPDSKGFQNWEMLIKEWFGIVAYWMRGYI